jgi:beta-phosphoglucomutase
MRDIRDNIKFSRLLSLPYWAFDFDGVVVDSSALHANAFKRVFEEIGIEFTDYALIAGRSTRDAVESLLLKAGRTTVAAEVSLLVAKKQRMVIDLIARGEGLECTEGIKELLEWCRRNGKSVSLVTSATKERIRSSLEALKLTDMFQFVVAAEDVAKGKPNPDPYLAAMRLTGEENASSFLVFEDSTSGVASAKAAGMSVIHFAAGGQPIPQADAAIESFTEVLASLNKLER